MRYSLSPREYEMLHRYLISRSPVAKRAPKPSRYAKEAKSSDDYNPSTVRLALRLFATSYTALKIWETVVPRLMARGKPAGYVSS